MIPEQYWQIIKRWFWLILLFGALGAAAAFYVLPASLGQSRTYNASVTLGVARFVSFGGTVTAGEAGAGVLLAEYTVSIANMATTPQSLSRLHAAVTDQGLLLSVPELADNVEVTPDTGLFRIIVRVTASNRRDAEMMAQETANLLIEQAAAEEERARATLVSITEPQRTELLTRLSDVSDLYQRQLEMLGAVDESDLRLALEDLALRGLPGADLSEEFKTIMHDLALITGDPELALLNFEKDALEEQLANIASAQENFAINLLSSGQPVFVLNPVEAVLAEPPSTLRKRDILALGGGAGLILGWIAGNVAEQVRTARGSHRRSEEEG